MGGIEDRAETLDDREEHFKGVMLRSMMWSIVFMELILIYGVRDMSFKEIVLFWVMLMP